MDASHPLAGGADDDRAQMGGVIREGGVTKPSAGIEVPEPPRAGLFGLELEPPARKHSADSTEEGLAVILPGQMVEKQQVGEQIQVRFRIDSGTGEDRLYLGGKDDAGSVLAEIERPASDGIAGKNQLAAGDAKQCEREIAHQPIKA